MLQLVAKLFFDVVLLFYLTILAYEGSSQLETDEAFVFNDFPPFIFQIGGLVVTDFAVLPALENYLHPESVAVSYATISDTCISQSCY